MLAKRKEYDCKNKKAYCLTIYRQIKRYCENPESKLYYNYGAKGIKCQFTSSLEIEYLYARDNAFAMEEPWLIRKNDSGNFSRENCYFVEALTHIREACERARLRK